MKYNPAMIIYDNRWIKNNGVQSEDCRHWPVNTHCLLLLLLFFFSVQNCASCHISTWPDYNTLETNDGFMICFRYDMMMRRNE